MKGIIEGKIITEDGSPMPGLTVTALGPGGSVEEKTDAGGNYRLVVVPGTIKVTVATTHFYLPVHESVALAANETLVLDFVLVPRNESSSTTRDAVEVVHCAVPGSRASG